MLQDERSASIYGDKPIIVEKERYCEIVDYYVQRYNISNQWFTQNYEQDFVRYLANYLSIPGDIYKPWDEANDKFMPVTNINIETYLARTLETIRGGRDFVTVYPRGRDDAEKVKLVQPYLRYTFETPMKGYSHLVYGYRTKYIYGTSIYHMPWNLDIQKRKIDGVYVWDKDSEDFIREIPEESNEELPPPKDFSGLDLKILLKNNENYVLKDLYEDVVIKDCPDLELLDIFNVRVDPAGGPDIQKHGYTIIETVETLDSIKRKAEAGIYSKSQVKLLINSLNSDTNDVDGIKTSTNLNLENQGKHSRDAIEGMTSNDTGVLNGVKIWICYGKHEIGYDDFEEETITIIANQKYLLRFRQTPFTVNGVPYRPLLTDRFITLPHRFYGIGQAQILEEMNYLLNHLVNQILNHGDLMNSPPLITPLEGAWESDLNMWGPGQNWQSDNSDGFKVLNTPDIKASQVTMITFVEGFLQKTLGISDFTLGQGAGSIVKNDTAHGLANILRETNRRIDFYAQNSHETFLKEMFEMILWESQKFLDESEIPRITDYSNQEVSFTFQNVTAEDIQGLYDIKIYTDSVTASKELEQAKWGNILTTYSQITDPATGMPIYDIKKIADRNLEVLGEDFPERYHLDVEKNPIMKEIGASPQEKRPSNPKIPSTKVNNQKESKLGPI